MKVEPILTVQDSNGVDCKIDVSAWTCVPFSLRGERFYLEIATNGSEIPAACDLTAAARSFIRGLLGNEIFSRFISQVWAFKHHHTKHGHRSAHATRLPESLKKVSPTVRCVYRRWQAGRPARDVLQRVQAPQAAQS